MKHLAVAALAAALVAAAGAPAAAEPTLDRNVAWILDALGLHEIPEGEGTVHDHTGVRTMTAADAIRLAAARAGDVDLAALASGASTEHGPYGVGDVWILEVGHGSVCANLEVDKYAPGVLPGTTVHPQFRTYDGWWGHARTNHPDVGQFTGLLTDWTTKMATGGAYSDGDVEWWGLSDFFCINFFSAYVLFPYIDGYAQHIH